MYTLWSVFLSLDFFQNKEGNSNLLMLKVSLIIIFGIEVSSAIFYTCYLFFCIKLSLFIPDEEAETQEAVFLGSNNLEVVKQGFTSKF